MGCNEDMTNVFSTGAAKTEDGFYTQGTLIGLSIFAVILLIIIYILMKIRKVIEKIHEEKYPEEVDVKIHWKQNKKSTFEDGR